MTRRLVLVGAAFTLVSFLGNGSRSASAQPPHGETGSTGGGESEKSNERCGNDGGACAVLASEHPSCLDPGKMAAQHERITHSLPKDVLAGVSKRFPDGMIVDNCSGAFSAPGREEFAFTIITPPNRIHRVVVLANGAVADLPWTSGSGFGVDDQMWHNSVEACDWFGEIACVAPQKVDSFLENFFGDFVKRNALFERDMHRLTSFCFSFDYAYNNWQCFGYDAKKKKVVRWGYQAVAD